MKRIVFLLMITFFLLSISGCHSVPALRQSYDTGGIVSISYNDIDAICDDTKLAAEAEKIIVTMDESNSILISLVVDSSILLTNNDLGGYDHLIVTNRAWVERFDDFSNFEAVKFDDIPEGMSKFLNAQMPLWTKSGSNDSSLPSGVDLYSYGGSGLLSLSFYAGDGGKIIEAKKPLVILIEGSVMDFNASSFLLPLSSSSNLLFTDAEQLRRLVGESNISKYVIEISEFKLN